MCLSHGYSNPKEKIDDPHILSRVDILNKKKDEKVNVGYE